MKLTFLKYKTTLILRKSNIPHVSIPFSKAKTAGIIFTVEDRQKHFAVKEFIRKLEADGKHVQVLEYLPEHTENHEFKFDFFTSKEVSFWGSITSPNAIQFAEAPFDFLFYLDQKPNPLLLHLLARSKAKCRVGQYWEEGSAYLDLMIESVNNTKSLLEAIHKYVGQLR